jgi:hypothetical protein
MNKTFIVSVSATVLLPLLQSCAINESDVRSFVEENVKECSGSVQNINLTREGPFTGKYYGFATVIVGDKEYTPELTAVSDGGNYIVKLEQNVCAVHELQKLSDDIQRDLGNMNF